MGGDWLAGAVWGVFLYGVLAGLGIALALWGGVHLVVWLLHHLAWVR